MTLGSEERPSLADLSRRLHNMSRTGKVVEVDHAAGKVKVQIGPNAQWMPVQAARMGKMKVWAPPSLGEQVTVSCESGLLENGVVTGSLASDSNPNVSDNGDKSIIQFDDGTSLEFDHGSSTLTINSPTALNITTPKLTLDGELQVTGNVTSPKFIGDLNGTAERAKAIG